jgi:5-methyltetrahydrofolate--homocysteine methyltransferase
MTNSQQRWRASKKIQQRARELRKEMTPAEKKLWQVLRGNQLDGLYFRRQHAVGTYILDFVCIQEKLVIEVDGGSHLEQEEYDQERTRWLEEEKGYQVIRFTNDDVLKNIHEVVEAIRDAVKGPHLTSPASGGGTSSPPVHGGSQRGAKKD